MNKQDRKELLALIYEWIESNPKLQFEDEAKQLAKASIMTWYKCELQKEDYFRTVYKLKEMIKQWKGENEDEDEE